MDWQLIVVAAIVLAAAGYLLRQTWRTWSGRKSGCSSGCGKKAPCASSNGVPLIPIEELTLRRRPPGRT